MGKHIQQFPHCDPRVLHAPEDNCQWCNMHPEWQELRKMWGIAFTGHSFDKHGKPFEDQYGNTQLPCPAEANRGMRSINSWGGNIAFTPEVEKATDEAFDKFRREFKEHFHERYPDIEIDFDWEETGGEG
jgi:hypothetical protein